MKGENGEVLTDERKIRGRWEKYLEPLLNKKNPRAVVRNEILNQAITLGIRKKAEKALGYMKSNKATEPANISIKAWKSLGEKCVWISIGKNVISF